MKLGDKPALKLLGCHWNVDLVLWCQGVIDWCFVPCEIGEMRGRATVSKSEIILVGGLVMWWNGFD